jgi:hypothetical protein
VSEPRWAATLTALRAAADKPRHRMGIARPAAQAAEQNRCSVALLFQFPGIGERWLTQDNWAS